MYHKSCTNERMFDNNYSIYIVYVRVVHACIMMHHACVQNDAIDV